MNTCQSRKHAAKFNYMTFPGQESVETAKKERNAMKTPLTACKNCQPNLSQHETEVLNFNKMPLAS